MLKYDTPESELTKLADGMDKTTRQVVSKTLAVYNPEKDNFEVNIWICYFGKKKATHEITF
jgi:endonuclease III